jgi:hypothetical protein
VLLKGVILRRMLDIVVCGDSIINQPRNGFACLIRTDKKKPESLVIARYSGLYTVTPTQ